MAWPPARASLLDGKAFQKRFFMGRIKELWLARLQQVSLTGQLQW